MSDTIDAVPRRDERALWQSRLKSTETLANRALQREKDGDLNASYSLCLQAARAYLWLIRNSPDETTTKTLKAISAKLLTRAEKIKARKKDVHATPISRLDEYEQETVLDNSSIVRGRVFRPWMSQLPLELLDGVLYSDPGGHFSLSKEQQDRLDAFKRISELSDSPVILSSEADPRRIWQSCVTDCTVIASLISCLQHSRRFSSHLSTCLLYPQDSFGCPKYNPLGRYLAKLFLNGTWRAVNIDDYLPVDSDGLVLCAYMQPRNHYWAALLEKAFVKLHGGYIIPGSDAAADIYTFTGWIPESIDLHRPQFRSEKTWRSLEQAFNAGQCLLSLGSGTNGVTLPDGRLLASKHAFAIVGLHEDPSGNRVLELVDPWVASASPATDCSKKTALKIAWELVCTQFSILYCNWDPKVFENSETLHLKVSETAPLHLDIQLGPSASIQQDEVWVLLSKHTDTKVEDEYVSLQVREDVTSHAAWAQAVEPKTEYTNSPYILVKIKPERNQARLKVLVAKTGLREVLSFTLSVYSQCPLYVIGASMSLPHSTIVDGAWQSRSAGGNPTSPSYVHNPQYTLVVDDKQPAQLQVNLTASKSVPVNLKLIRQGVGREGRIQQFETCAIVADSGAYTYRSASLTAKDLPSGSYLLVPSTFEEGQEASFSLRIDSSIPLQVPSLVPAEDSGKFSRVYRGNLGIPDNARMLGGSAYLENPRYLIQPRQVTWVSLRLCQISDFSAPLNVSIFADLPIHGESTRPVGSSGPYAAYVAGVTMSPIKLRPVPQGYMLIVSAASGTATSVEYELSVLSDHPVDVSRIPSGAYA